MRTIGANRHLHSVVCLCDKYATDEDNLYARLDSLLTQFPDWTMSAQSRYIFGYIAMPYISTFSPIPATEEGRTLLAENGGVGPIKTTLKVMKRLYDEGRSFLDLEKAVIDHVKSCCKSVGRPTKEYAAQLRILAHLFPDSMDEYKVQIAGECCNAV